MINIFNKQHKLIMLFLAFTFVLSSCKKWEDHNEPNALSLNKSLLQEIARNPDLHLFHDYLVQTGYDTVLLAAKSFTIWAPSNNALEAVDPLIINDAAKLKSLIGNHIANLSFYTTEPNPSIRVKMLNNKNVNFTNTKFDEAKILVSNQTYGNGVLHIVDKAIVPQLSIWEYLNTSGTGELQKQALLSLNYSLRDVSKSEIIGYDQTTGNPIYKPGVGVFNYNRYLRANDISNEDSVYTYIILTDEAFNDQKAKLAPYFLTDISTVSDSLTKYNVIKDLAIKGVYDKDNLPSQIYSAKDSTVYQLDKTAIVSTYKASNGVVFVMNKLDYDMVSKIKPVIIQGESGYTLQTSKTVQIRTRRNSLDPTSPLYNSYFKDLLIENHGTSGFWVKYNTTLKAVKYKVYFRAVRDFNLIPAVGLTDLSYFRTKIAFNINTAAEIPYSEKVGVIANTNGTFSPNYGEVYAGEYTVAKYGSMGVFLVANTVTTNGLNSLLLDYIKLVPVP
jgi:uncharacterized surface protein with fasciclin (FAS1) repeats